MRLPSRDVALGGLVAAAALVLYAVTLCPTIYVEDAAEFSTAAAVFGVPHPPGYPLYTLLAGLFVRALPLGALAWRTNLFSAVCGAGAVAVLFVLLRRLGSSRPAALAATLCFAVGTTFWSQCLAAEVHALDALLVALTLLAVFEAVRAPTLRAFALAGLALGLALGHRNLNLLFLGPLVVLLARAARGNERRGRLLACALAAAAASALVYLYLPLAARRDPALAMGAPTTLARLWEVVSTHAYVRHLGAASLATNIVRLGGFVHDLPANLGIGLLAAPLGFVAWWRRGEGAPLVSIAWMFAACLVFAAFYDVLDVDAYLIPAYLALAVAAGIGFDAWRGKWQALLPVVALMGVATGFSSVDLRHTTLARDYGRQLLASAPPGALILSFGDTETHVLTYEQAVEHARADVVVVSVNELAPWYVEQLMRRHPEVVWPSADAELGTRWLSELVRAQTSRRVCLTQPLGLGLGDGRLVPTGLLFCRAPRLDAGELARSLEFWSTAVTPSSAALDHPEVHVQMVAFAFALSRFSLAGALAEVGNLAGARVQLEAVVAAKPDVSENAIVDAVQAIGRTRHAALALGQRAAHALSLDPHDPRFLTLLRL